MNSNYLSIDPGGTVGVAMFDEQGRPTLNRAIKGEDKFMDWLEDLHPLPGTIILENYRVRGMGRGNAMSTLPTVQLIGMIKRYAKKNKIPIVLQEPANLYIGLMFLGIREAYPRGVHVPDDVSALAHGVYYLTKSGIIQRKLNREGK